MSRFRVIEGGESPIRPEAELSDGSKVEAHACSECSGRVGYLFDRLILTSVGAIVADGEVVGSEEYWACAGCGRLFYRA
jgi:hypothetical protein